MTHNILRLPQVKLRTGLSRTTIYHRISEGTFPSQIPLGTRAVGWIEDEVNAWLEQQIASKPTDVQKNTVNRNGKGK